MMSRRTLCLWMILATISFGQDDSRLLRFPHRQGDRIVFVKGGDLFAGTISSGEAHRLTSFAAGLEVMPRISPDGEWVAFSGEYAGSRQIYVVPFSGGQPRQLTFYPDVGPMPPRGGYDNLPYDWTPDGKKILVRMNRTPYGQRVGRYYLVDPFAGGLEVALAVPEGGAASFSDDGKKLAYNPTSREWRTWKRYRAGRAQDVHIFDLETNTATRITDYAGTDSQPLWLGDRIYFVSDRSGTLNLWAHDLATGRERQVTSFKDRDVTFPSRGQGGLIFECDGYLWTLAAGSEELQRLKIKVQDDAPYLRPVWVKGEALGAHDLSPEAKEVLAESRGDLYRIFSDGSEPQRLNTPENRRERSPRWSPDGRFLAYLAEAGATYQVFLYDRALDRERQLTTGLTDWILDLDFAPDGKSLAITDKGGYLHLVAVDTAELRQLDQGKFGVPSSLAWSPDSRYLSYVKRGENELGTIWIADTQTGATQAVSSVDWDDSAPAFDAQGRYLFFVSARDFKYSDLNFSERIYGLKLSDEFPAPLELRTVEEPRPDAKKDESADVTDDSAAAAPLDFAAIAAMEFVLPLPSSNYGSLQGETNGLLFSQGGDLKLFNFESQETKTVLEGVSNYRVAAKENQLVYARAGKLYLAARRPGQKAYAEALNSAGIEHRIDPLKDWSQMFFDAWRIVRDWFYDPQLHRVDWLATRARYEPLLQHMTHRSDLDFILGEMIGELNVGHAYVQSAGLPAPEAVAVGCLGCELVQDERGFRISHIFESENWTEDGRNPLRDPELDVEVGDYLVAINGRTLAASDNPYRWLEGRVGKKTQISIGAAADPTLIRDYELRPIKSEVTLRYIDWVAQNRRLVTEASGGRIGYIHVPNTAVEGHRRFYEGIYAYARTKEALIIDDRYNGGGFIPDRMAQILATKPLNYWARRSAELGATPRLSFSGKTLMLINGYSSSGGDAFPYYYRKLGAGLLMGTTTWGGLVGISFEPGLIDGGRIKVPSFAFVNAEGDWAVEAEGVQPDIEVIDDAGRIAAGEQPVLEAAIKHLMAELELESPKKRPPVPDGPDRSK